MISAVMQAALEDLKSCGKFYTWYNQQNLTSKMRIKLDRALANSLWFEFYGGSEAYFHFLGLSDHFLVTINAPGYVTGFLWLSYVFCCTETEVAKNAIKDPAPLCLL
ncbi:hypothetical protein Droror1_Dr00016342 [Drosera rotundifolia]